MLEKQTQSSHPMPSWKEHMDVKENIFEGGLCWEHILWSARDIAPGSQN